MSTPEGADAELPRYPGLTFAARFWLYQRREPLSLVYWVLVAVLTAAPAASSVFGHQRHPAVILASAVLGTAFVGIFHANSAGLTGPAFVLEATALGRGRDLRAYFSGQNLVLCVIGAPLVVAGRHSCAPARAGLLRLPDWRPPHPGGHRGAGRAGDRRCSACCERAGRDPDRGDARPEVFNARNSSVERRPSSAAQSRPDAGSPSLRWPRLRYPGGYAAPRPCRDSVQSCWMVPSAYYSRWSRSSSLGLASRWRRSASWRALCRPALLTADGDGRPAPPSPYVDYVFKEDSCNGP